MGEPKAFPEFSNPNLSEDAVRWVKTDARYCEECRERGGWLPRVLREDCPQCGGEDIYGDCNDFCAECEFCCGC